MTRRDRLLTVAELAGFAAVTASAAVTAFALAGGFAATAAGLFVGGIEAVYLANAYATSEAPAGGSNA